MSSTEAVMESDQQSLLVEQASLLLRSEKLKNENNSTSTRLHLENVKAVIEDLVLKIDENNCGGTIVPLYKLLFATNKQIREFRSLIISGEYFSSLDQVWTSRQLPFTNANVSLFDRRHSVLLKLRDNGMTYYETTMDITENMIEVDDQSSTSRSVTSTSERGINQLDIFGVMGTFLDSAHLMPRSTKDAAKWHLIVPGVLSDNVRGTSDEKMQMFINGFHKPPYDKSKRMKRVDYSGIQHFPTNKILLGQSVFLDTFHCLLIIPILSREAITNWDGVGYEAIVLAANVPVIPETPALVLRRIGALYGADMRPDDEILAKPHEIELCRELLEELILVVAKSFVEYHATDEQMLSKDNAADTLTTLQTTLKERLMVPTPIGLSDSSPQRVRKTRFIDFHQNNNNNEDLHRAPDPMLLLSKAVSNWLHIHKLDGISPSIENDMTFSETTSMSSSYNSKDENHHVVYNFTRETNHLPVRQQPEYVYNPPVTEIAFVNDDELSVSSDFK